MDIIKDKLTEEEKLDHLTKTLKLMKEHILPVTQSKVIWLKEPKIIIEKLQTQIDLLRDAIAGKKGIPVVKEEKAGKEEKEEQEQEEKEQNQGKDTGKQPKTNKE